MSIYDVFDKIRNDKYSTNYSYMESRVCEYEKRKAKQAEFISDLSTAVQEDYGFNKKASDLIVQNAVEEGDSYYDTVIIAQKYADMIDEFLKIQF